MKSRITVDGIEYERVEKDTGEKMHIVIVDNRGLTFVGRCDLSGDNEQIVIRDANDLLTLAEIPEEAVTKMVRRYRGK